jgi:uncharacterized Zn finger protein
MKCEHRNLARIGITVREEGTYYLYHCHECGTEFRIADAAMKFYRATIPTPKKNIPEGQ